MARTQWEPLLEREVPVSPLTVNGYTAVPLKEAARPRKLFWFAVRNDMVVNIFNLAHCIMNIVLFYAGQWVICPTLPDGKHLVKV